MACNLAIDAAAEHGPGGFGQRHGLHGSLLAGF